MVTLYEKWGEKAEEVPLSGGGVTCQELRGAILNEQKNQQSLLRTCR